MHKESRNDTGQLGKRAILVNSIISVCAGDCATVVSGLLSLERFWCWI